MLSYSARTPRGSLQEEEPTNANGEAAALRGRSPAQGARLGWWERLTGCRRDSIVRSASGEPLPASRPPSDAMLTSKCDRRRIGAPPVRRGCPDVSSVQPGSRHPTGAPDVRSARIRGADQPLGAARRAGGPGASQLEAGAKCGATIRRTDSSDATRLRTRARRRSRCAAFDGLPPRSGQQGRPTIQIGRANSARSGTQAASTAAGLVAETKTYGLCRT